MSDIMPMPYAAAFIVRAIWTSSPMTGHVQQTGFAVLRRRDSPDGHEAVAGRFLAGDCGLDEAHRRAVARADRLNNDVTLP